MPQQKKPHNVPPLMASMNNQMLLIDAGADSLFQSSIDHMMSDAVVCADMNSATDMAATASDEEFWGHGDEDDWRTYYRPYNVVNGVLQIPVMGVLIAKLSLTFGRWATGYKYIEMAVKRGREDYANGRISGIAMVIDSPGGMVTDCFELCAKIREAASEMPVRAFAADHAYSAAYAIASSCGRPLSVTSSGGVGSIGVVTLHLSFAGAMEQRGIVATFVFAGEGKTDGNPYENLSPEAKARIQARINKIFGLFVSTVSIGRDMEEDDVIACKAYTYDAEDGIEKGLADKIGALDEELAAYALEISEQGDFYMSNFQPQSTGRKPGDSTASAPVAGEGVSLETHRQEVQAAEQRGENRGRTEGATAERTRISAIMGSAEATARPVAAQQFAMETDMPADKVVAFLKGLPEEKAAVVEPQTPAATTTTPAPQATTQKPRNHFAEHMNSTAHPDVGAGDENAQAGGDAEPTAEEMSNSILSAFAADTGHGPKKKTA